MTKVYLVNDELHETCLGAFSSEEKAEEMIEACKFLGDELTWVDYDVDEPLSKLNMFNELEKNGEKIYYLSNHGMLWNDEVIWGKWYINTAIAANIIDIEYDGDSSKEFSLNREKNWTRYAIIKAHSEDEAIEIAEKIMVRL